MKKNTYIALLIACCSLLVLLPTYVSSQTIQPIIPQQEDMSVARTSFGISYEALSNSEMKTVYNHGLYGIHLRRLSWAWDEIGILFGGGVIGGEGSATVVDHSWQIETNDVGFYALALEGSFIARLPNERPFKEVTPYIGAGFDVFGGMEKLSVIIQQGTSVVRGDGSALRGSVAGHGLAGVYIPTGKQNAMEVEFTMLFAGSTGYHDLMTGSEQATFEQSIYNVVQRPNFNLTGFRLSVGVIL